MMKKLFGAALLTLLGTMTHNAYAESVVNYTYMGEEVQDFSYYGSGSPERYDAAMCINEPILSNYKITKVTAYVAGGLEVSKSTIWLSRELKLEKRLNKPDILEANVEITSGYLDGMRCGVLEYELPEPVEVGETSLYAGYTVTVSNNTTEAGAKPLMVYNTYNPNGFWLHASSSQITWENISGNREVLAIVVTLEGENNTMALNISNMGMTYAKRGNNFTSTASVCNVGGYPIDNLEYKYTVDGENEKTYTVDLENSIAPNPGVLVPLTLRFDAIEELEEHKVEVTITKVNGVDNQSAQATTSFTAYIIPIEPVHRPLMEEFTGLWCQWCPRGYVAMEEVNKNFGSGVVVLSYHNRDEMQVTTTYPMPVTNYPTASVDREKLVDPYSGGMPGNGLGIFTVLDNAIAQLPAASVEVKNIALSDDKSKVTFDVTTAFAFMNGDEYRIGYVLTANGLYNEYWGQVNAYSEQGGYDGTPLEEFTKLPGKVYGLIYNDVVVNVEGMNGIAGSIPNDIKIGEEYTRSCQMGIANNPVIQDPEQLVVNVFIVNKTTGRIVNANKGYVNEKYNPDPTPDQPDPDQPGSGVEEIKGEPVATEYFDLQGRKINNPGKGLYIKHTRLSNGETEISKVIF